MPPIVDFTSECTREHEWDNIAAIHSGLVMTTTWSFKKCKMGDLKLVPEQYQNKNRTDFNVEATCISLTHCGNFVIIGKMAQDKHSMHFEKSKINYFFFFLFQVIQLVMLRDLIFNLVFIVNNMVEQKKRIKQLFGVFIVTI